jgi:hypothetical protein
MRVRNVINIAVLGLAAILCRAQVYAQGIDMVSYTPLKKGNFEFISVHSRANLATGRNSAVHVKKFHANSSSLLINAGMLRFSNPVFVRNNAFVRKGSHNSAGIYPVFAIDVLNIAGAVYDYTQNVSASVAANIPQNTLYLQGRDLDFREREIKLGSNQGIVIDGVLLRAPPAACSEVKWKAVQGYLTLVDTDLKNYTVLVCD